MFCSFLMILRSRYLCQLTRSFIFRSQEPPKGFQNFYSKSDLEDLRNEPPETNWNFFRATAFGAGVIFLLLSSRGNHEVGDEISFNEFVGDYLVKGRVQSIDIVNKEYARVSIKDSQKPLLISLGNSESFENRLDFIQRDLGIHYTEYIPTRHVFEKHFDYSSWARNFLILGVTLIPTILLYRIFRGQQPAGLKRGKNPFTQGKNFTELSEKPNIRFSDIAGCHQAKVEVQEYVEFLKFPEKFRAVGAKLPKGGLLCGPPGTGKTMMAKAIAGEASVPFFSISGSDFIEMFVGVGASRVRELFAQARQRAPAIIFIDEIDAVGRKRNKGGFGGSNDERESTLNQLLVELDGFSSQDNVVVLAGTNRADILDSALVRPGRFDRSITLERPDISDRQEIFQLYLKKVKLHESLKVEEMAKTMAALTPGSSGADIRRLCNEAAIYAGRNNRNSVTDEDFTLAADRILAGLKKNKNYLTAAQRRSIALHESGHVVAGWFLKHADPLLKVSIVPRTSGALGFAQYLPSEIALYIKEELLDRVCVALGGRASEDLFLKSLSTGAVDDLDKVTKIIYSMISLYGLFPETTGLLSYQRKDDSPELYRAYSEKTAQEMDRLAKTIVSEQYERCKEILLKHETKLMALCEKLLEKETLNLESLKEILGERTFE